MGTGLLRSSPALFILRISRSTLSAFAAAGETATPIGESAAYDFAALRFLSKYALLGAVRVRVRFGDDIPACCGGIGAVVARGIGGARGTIVSSSFTDSRVRSRSGQAASEDSSTSVSVAGLWALDALADGRGNIGVDGG